MSTNERYFCVCVGEGVASIPGQTQQSTTKGAFLKECKWGETPTLRFLGGSAELQERVILVAEEWTKVANIKLNFQDSGPTDIRIAFVQGNGSWSYMGTKCRQIPEPQPTMNFGWLTSTSPDEELRSVVLHEFGHALGLIHEHQNPSGGGIKWNIDAVIKDLSGPPNNWDLATIRENMFKKYEPGALLMTDVDPTSIMMYPLPLSWTQDGTSAQLNSSLSDLDKELIQQAYPN